MPLANCLKQLPFSVEEKLSLRQAANEHGEAKAVKDALDLAHSERQEIHDAILKASPELSAKHNAQSEVAQAKQALDAAKITGKERTDTIASVRKGELTAADVAEAHPRVEEKSVEPQVIDFETFAAMNGASRQDIGEAALHRSSNKKSPNTHRKQVEAQAREDQKLILRREELRKEYDNQVSEGKIRPLTPKESIIATANGMPELEATQAARRIAEKRGWEWQEQPAEQKPEVPQVEVEKQVEPVADKVAEPEKPSEEALFARTNDQDEQVHRLLDAHANDKGYTREDAVHDYTTGKRLDSAGKEYDAMYSRETEGDKNESQESTQPNEANREFTDKLEAALKRGGHDFTITPVLGRVRLGDTSDGGGRASIRSAERIAKLFGKDVVWIKSKGDFPINGVVEPKTLPDKIFINVDSPLAVHLVMGHELSHHMEVDSPDVYKRLVTTVEKLFRNREDYRTRLGFKKEDSEIIVTKEMVGDVMGDSFSHPEFWKDVAKANPLAARSIGNKVMAWLNKMAAKLQGVHGFGSDQIVTDVNAARRAVAEAVAEYSMNRAGTRESDANELYREAYKPQFSPAERQPIGEGVMASKPHEAFYSQLRVAMRDAPDKIFGNAKSVSDWLNANASKLGVKKAEIEATGLDDWLKLQGKVTKADVQTFLNANGVQVKDVTLADTKFASYQLPGGNNYKELLLTLPAKAPRSFEEILADRGLTEDEFDALPSRKRAFITDEIRAVRDAEQRNAGFKSSHFDQPNILAHIRFNERTDAEGKRVLFLEELQSDWGQKGKKEGFGSKELTSEEKELQALNKITWSANGKWTPEQELRHRELVGKHVDMSLQRKLSTNTVPSAPFVTDTKAWTALALKRMVRYASENGFEKISWTTGTQQAARYDLSKQVSKVSWALKYDNKVDIYADKDGSTQRLGTYEVDKLSDVVGKTLADKISAQHAAGEKNGEFSGLDLKIGGEGMKGYYDVIVPSVARDILKRLGVGLEAPDSDKSGASSIVEAGVHTVNLPDIGKVSGFTITPELRNKVMAEGIPLFSRISEAADKLKEHEAIKGSRLVKQGEENPEETGILTKAVESIKTGFNELKEAYTRSPEFTESKKIIGNLTGEKQERDFNLSKIAKQLKDDHAPDRRLAMARYAEAGGDIDLLKSWAATEPEAFRKGLTDAMNLTSKEKETAAFTRMQSDASAEVAQQHGILEALIENYVRHEWERASPEGEKLIAIANSGILNDHPREAMKRVFATNHEGIMFGAVPKNMDIAYQFIAGQQHIGDAISARKALTELMHSTEKDGRPTVAVGGAGSMIEEGAEEKPYFVKPNVKPADAYDYKFIDNASLRHWKWVGSDSEGKAILMQGNMYIHPEAYGRMNALLGRSAIRAYEIPSRIPVVGGTHPGDAMLKAGAFIKSTMLVGPFHQFHLAEHAVFHGVNPMNTPEIDFDTRPLLREGVTHGLMLYNHNAMHEFAEGLASGGLLHKIPYAGDQLKRYQEWLFQDYIPRLKASMFEKAVGKALDYYKEDMANGKLTRDQLLDNAAKQANAAFGELNYQYMGRNKTYQDALRIALLAPDFLEARFKFAGQALRPKGKEQAMALIRAALIMGLGAQTINMLFGDDHEMHWDRPFSVIMGGREFSPRSVVGDIAHLVEDPRGFWYHRLNPLWGRPIDELATGRDINGQKETLEDSIKSVLKSWFPIPLQGLFKDNTGQSQLQSVRNTLLQSIGVSNFVTKSSAQKLMSDYNFDKMQIGIRTKEELDRARALRTIEATLRNGDKDKAKDLFNEGHANHILKAQDYAYIVKRASQDPLVNSFRHLTYDQAVQVMDAATEDERKKLKLAFMEKKISNVRRQAALGVSVD